MVAFLLAGLARCHISSFLTNAISPFGESVSPCELSKPFSFKEEKGFNC
jgi:hypothetical protein